MASGGLQIIHKRKGMKNLLKTIVALQMYYVTCGIHRNEGRRRVKSSSSNKSSVNRATLASLLEKTVSWIQPKTVTIPTHDGEEVTIWAGARLRRPARIFIHLNLLPNIWNGLRSFIRTRVLLLLKKQRVGATGAKKFLKALGVKALEEQQARINRKDTASNSEITEKIKGFNHPLFDTGALLESLKYKINPNFNKGGKRLLRLKYLTQIDSWIRELNRK